MLTIQGLKTETLSNGNTIEYKVINGIAYHFNTPMEVCEVLENVRATRKIIRVYYGTREPYKNWNEEHCNTGYVGNSTGSIKIPLLVYNSRSYDSGALMDDCILKIVDTKTKKVLYQYENYVNPVVELIPNEKNNEYPYSIFVESSLYSNHKTLKDASRLLNKLI